LVAWAARAARRHSGDDATIYLMFFGREPVAHRPVNRAGVA
jgi:hypothetical protein